PSKNVERATAVGNLNGNLFLLRSYDEGDVSKLNLRTVSALRKR
ncbi:uncharacterized, partial [Tachysurus ichikawai]